MAVEQQLVADQRLLECRAHERVARTGVLEHLKVHPEEREVDDEGDEDEAQRTRRKVPPEVFLFIGYQVKNTTRYPDHVPWCAPPCGRRGYPRGR